MSDGRDHDNTNETDNNAAQAPSFEQFMAQWPPDVLEALGAPGDLYRDGAMRINAACAFVGVGRDTLYRLMQRGELPYTQLNGNRLIPKRALVELLEAGTEKASRPPPKRQPRIRRDK